MFEAGADAQRKAFARWEMPSETELVSQNSSQLRLKLTTRERRDRERATPHRGELLFIDFVVCMRAPFSACKDKNKNIETQLLVLRFLFSYASFALRRWRKEARRMSHQKAGTRDELKENERERE